MFSSVASHPLGGLVARSREVKGPRQRCQQRVERAFVASEEAADDARPIGATAAALEHQRQRRRRPDVHRNVGRGAHARRARQDMPVSLREHDQVAFFETNRRLADGVSPAGAAGDQVVLDDALGARDHHRRDLVRRRRFRHPRRAQLEVEVHRAGQADRTKDVRQDISGGSSAVPRRTPGHAVRTNGQVVRCIRMACKANRSLAHGCKHHTSHSVDLPRNPARPVVQAGPRRHRSSQSEGRPAGPGEG